MKNCASRVCGAMLSLGAALMLLSPMESAYAVPSTVAGSGTWSTTTAVPACGATEYGTLRITYSGGSYSAQYTASNSVNDDCSVGGGWSCSRSGYAASSDYLTTSQFSAALNSLVMSCVGSARIQSLSFGSADAVSASGTYAGVAFSYQMTRTSSSRNANDCVFDWAETAYASLFAPSGATSQTASGYYYRYYSQTNAYLAVSTSNDHLLYLGPASGNTVLDAGPMSGWKATAGCGG